MLAVETHNLTKMFHKLKAVDELNLEIKEAEIYSLLGPNGSGKTTTVRMLTGLLRPTIGGAKVLGLDISDNLQEIRGRVGHLTETPALYERLTVRQNLDFFAKLYKVPETEIKPRIEEIADLFELPEKLDEPAGTLSKGMKQKVAIARAMFHEPELIFLDEPTASLSPESSKVIREQILKLAKKERRTFFICTHNLFEAERLSSRVGIINHGRLVAQGSPAELRELRKDETVTVFRFSTWENNTKGFFEDLKIEIIEQNQDQKYVSVIIKNIEKQTSSIIGSLAKNNFQLVEVKHEFPTLERIYLELIELERVPRDENNMEES
ncbi:MAG: ABC transporter ATP-binding protein [Candidatus Heimdallarchaeota archaeon]|nr:ABC transporter ATP-binding protein [Candidatus Heimdallarchaeota archaeon]MCK4254280.1 ABC transporter ATP-binding protein [Candidatus Heimdallarchaeota archaeon]